MKIENGDIEKTGEIIRDHKTSPERLRKIMKRRIEA
jgi:hypothetical protein